MTEETTSCGIPLKPVYRPEDIADIAYQTSLNDPGSFPYTRGRFSATQRHGSWIQRELSGEGDPARSNEQFKYLLKKGQTGIDVIGDSPAMGWLDPDHPLAAHSVGTQGTSLCCLQDYRDLLADIHLEEISISQSMIASSFAVACYYLVAKERGFSPAKLRGSIIQAPFYCEDCSYATQLPFALRLRQTCDSIEFCAREMPKFHGFLEDTYYISDAALDVVEEMALGFVEIRHVVRELLKRGLDIDSFAPRIGILVNCRMDIFEEIAKIRATRRLFARMMRDEFGAKDPRSLSTVITCHTSGLTLTSQQPVNNIVRGAIQALALVLSGVQAIEISAFDEAYRTPSPESHLIGLRTQQVIHLESNAAKVADPLGGSYYVESLTNAVEKRIWDMVTQIEAMGDPAALLDKGWFRRIFVEASERYARAVQDGSLPKVGVNCHQIPEEEDTLLRDVSERKHEPCWEHVERIRAMKRERDKARHEAALLELYHKAKQEKENLMNPIIKAVTADATLGEIAGVMRMAYGAKYDPYGLVEPVISL
jgi:methylmalonyl-CoA mutase N-terminal domain/subunit